jgi:hypothetical protein
MLTIPADEKLHEALQERAELQGKTVPELAREILSEAVAERALAERIGHLRGQVHLQEDASEPQRSYEPAKRVGRALDRFIGTWSAEKEAEVLKAVEVFEQVDESFWQ